MTTAASHPETPGKPYRAQACRNRFVISTVTFPYELNELPALSRGV